MTIDVVDILRRTELLRSVPDADLVAIAAASRLRAFRRGQVVFQRDDPSDTVIVVISGRVKVVVRSADGGELTLTAIQPGGLFGELGIADGGGRSTDAETLEDCELLLVPLPMVKEVCARVPDAARALTASVAANLRRLTEAAADLVFLDLPRRVAKVLLSQPPGDDGTLRLEDEPGGARAPGGRHPAKRERRAARFRETGVARRPGPYRHRDAAGGPGTVRRNGGVGKVTPAASATRLTSQDVFSHADRRCSIRDTGDRNREGKVTTACPPACTTMTAMTPRATCTVSDRRRQIPARRLSVS